MRLLAAASFALTLATGLALVCPTEARAEQTDGRLHVRVSVVDSCAVSSSALPVPSTHAPEFALRCSAHAAPRVEHGPVQSVQSASYSGQVTLTTVLF